MRASTEFLQNAAENVGSFVDLSAVLPLYAAFHFRAQMAELVDALRSGRSVLMDVEVRVLFWAPNHSPEWFYFVQNTLKLLDIVIARYFFVYG